MSKVEDTYSNKNMPRLNQLQAGSLQDPVSYSGKAETNRVEATAGVLSHGEQISIFLMLILGSCMQAYANRAIEAVLVAPFFLLVGSVVVACFFSNRKPEMRAFLLMYAVCIFVGGLAQIYSLAVLGGVQSTTDAITTLRKIGPEAPFRTLETISTIHPGPLAIIVWQKVYEVTSWLGFKFGAYSGVMFNALVMGLIGSITVQIARELFGDDSWRLRRVGTLTAANGLFILSGATLLRDGFTTFFMALALWGSIRLLVRAEARWLLITATSIGISAWAMQWLRVEAVLLVVIYGILAFLFWLFERSGFVGLTVTFLFLFVILFGSTFLSIYVQDIQWTQTSELEKYNDIVIKDSAEDSLGLKFIFSQPLPIRLVLGSVSLLISPIPLWAHFRIGAFDYHWIKGYNGLYQLFMLPLVFAGSLMTFRLLFRNTKQSLPFMFLVMFFLINMVGIVATSLEQRHFGQFMSAFVIIATIPDTREKKTENELKSIKSWYFLGMLLLYLIWAILKVVQ